MGEMLDELLNLALSKQRVLSAVKYKSRRRDGRIPPLAVPLEFSWRGVAVQGLTAPQ